MQLTPTKVRREANRNTIASREATDTLDARPYHKHYLSQQLDKHRILLKKSNNRPIKIHALFKALPLFYRFLESSSTVLTGSERDSHTCVACSQGWSTRVRALAYAPGSPPPNALLGRHFRDRDVVNVVVGGQRPVSFRFSAAQSLVDGAFVRGKGNFLPRQAEP